MSRLVIGELPRKHYKHVRSALADMTVQEWRDLFDMCDCDACHRTGGETAHPFGIDPPCARHTHVREPRPAGWFWAYTLLREDGAEMVGLSRDLDLAGQVEMIREAIHA